MTGRERMLCAMAHEEPDRVPLVMGISNATGIKMEPYRKLKKLLGIEAPEQYLYDWPELGTAKVDEKTLLRLGVDCRAVLDRYPRWVYEKNQSRGVHDPFVDDWGTGQTEVEPGKWFPGIHPLATTNTLKDIEDYPWPDMDDPTRLEGVAEQARELADQGEYAVLACPWLLFPFERCHALQGLDVFLANMLMEPNFAQALLWKVEELCERLLGHFLDQTGTYLDLLKLGDDLGSQRGLLISPELYRCMLKPVHAKLIAFAKSKTKAKIFFHTDGDVFDLIPDLIEIGVDVLNPIQSGSGRMSDLELLKKTYGKKLTFCGAIDTQRLLPYGSPGEVKAETKRVMGILGQGGGYMAAAVHTVMEGVPPENILAMTEAVRESGT